MGRRLLILLLCGVFFVSMSQAVSDPSISSVDDIGVKNQGSALSADEFNSIVDVIRGIRHDNNDTFGDVSDDKIGIGGVTSPSEMLDVNGRVKATFFIGDGSLLTNIPSAGWWSKNGATNEVSYSAANVGIGISDPSELLHISNTTSTQPVGLRVTGNRPVVRLEELDGNANENWQIEGAGGKLYFLTQNDAFAGASPKMAILQNGNVGIGTTSPIASLQVDDAFRVGETGLVYWGEDVETAGNRGYLSWGPGRAIVGSSDAGDDLSLYAAGAEKLRIKDDGDVGIGTTNPPSRLAVDGGYIGLDSDGDGNWGFITQAGETGIGLASSLSRATSPELYVGESGVVGIGTKTPEAQLHISGGAANVKITDTDTGADTLLITNSSVGGAVLSADHNSEVADSYLGFNVDGDIKMRITDDGDVGIGTTAPTAGLEVEKDTTELIAGIEIDSSGSGFGGSDTGLRVKLDGDSGWDSNGVQGSGNDDIALDVLGQIDNNPAFVRTFAVAGNGDVYARGNMGLGVFDPDEKLHVDGNIKADNFIKSDGSPIGGEWTKTAVDDLYYNSGNVGIGVTSPAQKLDVNGNAVVRDSMSVGASGIGDTYQLYVSANKAGVSGGGDYQRAIYASARPNSAYWDAGTSNHYATGVTSSSFATSGLGAGDTLTELQGVSIQHGNYSSSGTVNRSIGLKVIPYQRSGTIGNMYDIYLNNHVTGGTVTGNRYGIYQDNDGINYFKGNIGIGAIASTYPLEITDSSANVRITDSDTGADNYLLGNSSVGGFIVSADNNDEVAGSYLALNVDGSTKLRVEDNGNVGIGITSSAYKLAVKGGYIGLDSDDDADWGFLTQANENGIGLSSSLAKVLTPELYVSGSAAGRVGVNTITPTETLDVQGDTVLDGAVGIGRAPVGTYQFIVDSKFSGPAANESGQNNDYQRGIMARVRPNSNYWNAGTVDKYVSGVTSSVLLDGAVGTGKTVDDLHGAVLQYGTYDGATGTVDTATGLQITSYRKASTINTAYDIYLAAAEDGGTVNNHYGIYQNNEGENYLKGNTGIGTNTPLAKLHVNGKAKFGREGIVGNYNSTEVQGIWSIGHQYGIDTTNNDFGTQYGITYAHTNAGTDTNKKPIAGWGHQVLFTGNGVRNASISLTNGNAFFAGNVIGDAPTAANHLATKAYVDGSSGIWQVNAATDDVYYNGGNVGIGTNAPQEEFQINKTQGAPTAIAVTNSSTSTNTNTRAGLNLTANAGQIDMMVYGANASGSLGGSGKADAAYIRTSSSSPVSKMVVGTGSNNPLRFITNDTSRMTITGAGNVGIGTTNPTYGLEVVDKSVRITATQGTPIINTLPALDINLLDESSSAGASGAELALRIKIDGDAGWDASGVQNSGNDDVAIDVVSQETTVSSQKSVFRVAGNGDIYADGDVGIGTFAPSQKLDVVGNAEINGQITGTTKISFDQGSAYSIDTNASGLLFNGGEGGSDFLVYDTSSYTNQLRLGYGGTALLTSYDGGEDLELTSNAAQVRINDDFRLDGYQDIVNTSPTVRFSDTDHSNFHIHNNSDRLYFVSDDNDNNAYDDGEDSRIVMRNHSGVMKLGVGMTSPAYPLDVSGDVRVQGSLIIDSVDGIRTASGELKCGLDGNGVQLVMIGFNTSGLICGLPGGAADVVYQ